ncbi:MAG: MgtC/SapB family protein [Candidatus Hydrogenedentes bacterium]|nr:MgtC/SapB family protein [Candidatus Hydrogenedentota bacterium]
MDTLIPPDWESQIVRILLPLLIATMLGGMIGLERERKGRPAGLRTHILVCIGATLMMLIAPLLSNDPSRIAAGIITGIGFLGAGTIIHSEHEPTGLTTAATIWFTAALGIAVGSGHYLVGFVATVMVTFIVIILGKLALLIPTDRRLRVHFVSSSDSGTTERLREYFAEAGFRTADVLKIERQPNSPNTDFTFHLLSSDPHPAERLQECLEKLPTLKRPYTIEHF